MARIAGVNLPEQKRIEIALTYIYGIGLTTSKKILSIAKVDPNVRVKDLSSTDENKIRNIIESDHMVEGELKQKIFQDIKRLKDIRSYRGIRHKVGLPVRGQRTRTNAYTRKGHNIAVGGLKRILEKT